MSGQGFFLIGIAAVMASGLGSCASATGEWPSLMLDTDRPASAAAAQPAAPPDPARLSADRRIEPLVARLEEERRALAANEQRWQAQLASFEASRAKAQGAAGGSLAWADAQTALTRLNQIAADFDQGRLAVYQVAGNLAALAAQGQDVSEQIKDAGRLISRLDAAIARNLQTITQAQAQLTR